MVFWVAILAGALFVRIAIQIGFYKTWTMLFNIVIAVYLAVFLAPMIVGAVPAAAETSFDHALTLVVVAVGTFGILYGVSRACLKGEDSISVSFPRMFEIVLASVLGFLAGFLVFSFVAFLVCVTPLSEQAFVKNYGLDRRGQETNVAYVCWWCDLVNAFVAYEDSVRRAEHFIDELEQSAQSRVRPKTEGAAEPSKPVQPSREKEASAPNGAGEG